MNYKLTIDRNLMDLSPEPQPLGTLKRWKTEGKLELVEAEPTLRGHLSPDNSAWFVLNKKEDTKSSPKTSWQRMPSKLAAGKIKFAQVASILFPRRDTQRLNMTEVNDVAHMVKHHGSGNELFVTGNKENFIDGGRRELLKASFGVIAMTPEEAVRMLSEIEGWR